LEVAASVWMQLRTKSDSDDAERIRFYPLIRAIRMLFLLTLLSCWVGCWPRLSPRDRSHYALSDVLPHLISSDAHLL